RPPHGFRLLVDALALGTAALARAEADELPPLGDALLCIFHHGIDAGVPRATLLHVAVAAGVVAGFTAEQLVGWHAERLAPQIPQRDVDGGDRRRVDMAAPEELPAPEGLPDVLDARGVHADELGFPGADEGLDGGFLAGDARLAETGEALVGIDLDEGE